MTQTLRPSHCSNLVPIGIVSDVARVPYLESELPVNIFRTLAHAPKLADGFSRLGGRLLARTTLDPKMRELVINAISHRLDAPYEWSHHVKPAMDAGATSDELQALKDADLGKLGPLEGAAVAYALKVEANDVAQGDVDSLREVGLSDQQIVELTLLAGFYGMTARFLRAMDVDYDDGAPQGYAIP